MKKIIIILLFLFSFANLSLAAYQMQVRRDTAANWTSDNPTLAQGEWALETDTGKIKMGDGVTAWTSLPYFTGAAGSQTPWTSNINGGGYTLSNAGLNWNSLINIAGQNVNWNGDTLNSMGINWTDYRDIGTQGVNWYDINLTLRTLNGINPSTWLTANQNITWTGSGDVSGSASGQTSISPTLTLATVNSNVGSYTNANITVNGKGLITAASNGSGATSPGGISTQLQYNLSSAFAGANVYQDTNGNIGVGSQHPGQALDVQGTVRMVGMVMSTGAMNNYVLTSDSSGNGTWQAVSGTGTVTSITAQSPLSGGTITTTGNIGIGTALGSISTFGTTGNVGINSITPGQLLDVFGTVRASYLIPNNVTASTVLVSDSAKRIISASNLQDLAYCQTGGTNCPGGITGFANPSANVSTSAVNGSAVTAMRSDAAPAIDQTMAPTWTGLHTFNANPAIVTGAGDNVGIGSAHPGQILDVHGTIRSSALTASSPVISASDKSLTSGTYSGNTTELVTTTGAQTSGNLVSIDSNGNHIASGTANTAAGIVGLFSTCSGTQYLGADGSCHNASSGGTPGGSNTQVQYNNNGAFNGAANLVYSAGGNVGINSANPGQLLDVKGTIRSLGINATTNAAIGSTAVLGSSSSLLSNQPTILDVENNYTDTSSAVVDTPLGFGASLNPSADSATHIWTQWSELQTQGTHNFNGEYIGTFGEFDQESSGNLTGRGIGGDFEAHQRSGSCTTGSCLLAGLVGIAVNDGTGTVASMDGVQSEILNEGSNGTVTQFINFDAEGVVANGGSNIFTTGIGLYVGPLGATYNYGIYTNIANGAYDYSIYNSGTAPNYFNGNVGIGTFNVANANLTVMGGNVGIGTWIPGVILDTNGTVRMTGFNLSTSPSNGYVLTSDTNGNGTWQAATGGGTGNVGIGTVTRIPVYQGTTTIGSPYNNTMDSNGNVGVGSATPGQTLDVNGTARMVGFAMKTGATNNYVLTSDANGNGTWGAAGAETNYWLEAPGNVSINTTFNVGIGTINPTSLFSVQGNVGIGTPWASTVYNPSDGGNGAQTLQIAEGASGGMQITGISTNNGGNADFTIQTSNNNGSWDFSASKNISAGVYPLSGSMSIYDNINNVNPFIIGPNSPSDSIMIAPTGVGIGSYNPGQELDVKGTARITSAGATSPALLVPTGNVGLNSANPGQMLDVQGTVRSIGGFFTANVGIGTQANQTALSVMNGNVGIGTWAPTGQLVVGGTGNVGINSATPGMLLDVNGSIRAISGIIDVGIGTASLTHICIQNTNYTLVTCP